MIALLDKIRLITWVVYLFVLVDTFPATPRAPTLRDLNPAPFTDTTAIWAAPNLWGKLRDPFGAHQSKSPGATPKPLAILTSVLTEMFAPPLAAWMVAADTPDLTAKALILMPDCRINLFSFVPNRISDVYQKNGTVVHKNIDTYQKISTLGTWLTGTQNSSFG